MTSPVAVWLSFLATWADEARQRGTKAASAYLKAHQSLAACQDTLVHPSETVRVRGIGASIAERIERAYAQWCAQHGQDMPPKPGSMIAPSRSHTTARPRKTKTYIPEPRSGAHGLLVALYTRVLEDDDDEAQLGKSELIARAQPYCDSDYTMPGRSGAAPSSLVRHSQSNKTFITAWNSIKTLIHKGYVYRRGNPALFSLSPQGLEVAELVALAEGITRQAPEPLPSAPSPASPAAHEQAPPSVPRLYLPPRSQVPVIDLDSDDVDDIQICTPAKPLTISLMDSSPIVISSSPVPVPHVPYHILPAYSYTIHMIVDHREVRAKTVDGRITFHDALRERGVPCEGRVLELGDILWIARAKPHLPSEQQQAWAHMQEVVLDVVVERKRLDDLTSSLMDGRWHDQKQRLQQAGIGQVLYLVEDMHVSELVQRYGAQIQTALSSTQVIDGFFVHRTAHGQGTVDFLVTMHDTVQHMYKDKPLYVLREEQIQRDTYAQMQRMMRAEHPGTRFHTSFHTYQELHTKTSASGSLLDMWTRMLLCIRGVSPEKAQELTRRWPTPAHLLHAYAQCASVHDAQHLLSTTIDPATRLTRRRIGQALSKRVWHTLQSLTY